MDKASASSFQCPIPTGRGNDSYDIFLSFRGSDIREKFADHLYQSLVNAGTIPISVFKDDKSIPIGEEFETQIFGAISRSKISIPIVSKNYATSKWCLRELVHMMDCRKRTSHIVLPIFYEVKISDVRYLEGEFGEAYHSRKKNYENKYIHDFEKALRDVSYLQVWKSGKFVDGPEGEFVQEVVDTVRSELRRHFQLDVTKDLVGIDGHVQKIKNWADIPVPHARMIGIYGMGGIGKTTLAKAIYNELSKVFVDRSKILDIRDKADRKGIPYVQNLLIKGILPDERKVSEVDDGVSLLNSRFKCKKVLILLDDIDGGKKGGEQLQALARERDWFMAGSIIIVTTRYQDVLDQSKFTVDYKYPMNTLDEVHSVLLFNRHAFRMNCSPRDFEDTSCEIISTMGGLPLPLVVVGSYLFGKTNPKVWIDTLKQLKEQPHEDVQGSLMISYEALKPRHKEIFLDIACFFIGETSKFAMYMWDDCGFHPSQGIEELKLRCLIKIGDDGELKMHDQLRDLGRSIVAQGQPPERRSRLWVYEEAFRVLMEKKVTYGTPFSSLLSHIPGTQRVEAISLHDFGPVQQYTSEQFKNLQSLRFLELGPAALSGDFNQVFSQLSWLRWSGIEPGSFSAANLHLPNLSVLQLPGNDMTEHWGGWSSIMVAKRLKVLDLAYSKYLKCTPDLSAFTELDILILKNCPQLEQVHPSIGNFKSLVSLDLSWCPKLKELPEGVGELKELKELNLHEACIIEIPVSIGSLRKLEKLDASLCRSLREIPISIGNLSSLKHLNL
ncbi:disease resistance protein RPV1-like [Rhodamnia argentea]|uniref:Disease resistance protein RPV1-like n=1 Tax=Rhodamnia argentea TaxID=178133 RepID=A0A8B8QH12_9MYRT|nr:disease resistance protein RPV1-like [Rhodamnia argentea]